ncbi:FecR family protein [Ramlibacter alkalitolerans]|uniref:FecR domain-containing protein n=1 Tax=Ramlibacter alkalitolerans TaxID=2039631 RepID=A0ABS1JQ00_9BURK|nr:FecR domain-containing protein [Ramlibacter alkalitolerans]MBL0426354.1 FecR domain-containing protein [Ramlibacter alkalitolerans]
MRAAQLAFQWLASVATAGLLLAAPVQAQTSAGEVEFARGVGFAQTPGETPRTLGRGLPLKEGDRLTTAEGASAIVRLADGTRMTIRPKSEIVLQQVQFRDKAPDNGLLLQMVRGGLRAVTGLISKGSPDAARIQTPSATIGIRGTDFDARLCARDCGTESAAVPETARPNAVQASAKVVVAQGEVFAIDGAGQRRRLVEGGSIYPGDLVETARGAQAVLAFRDESRVTLGSQTRFRLDNFVYDEQNPGEGRFLASILRGTVRALTGLIARANNRNVGFSSATASIGIRGTGFDVLCTGTCAGDVAAADSEGFTVWTWLGAIAVMQQGQTALQVLQAGQGLFIPASGVVQPVTSQPLVEGARPDQVSVPANLFATRGLSDAEEGLFVFVREGDVDIASAREVLHLGRGEAGFAGPGGETARPTLIPKFIEFDRMPLPSARNPMVATVLTESGIRSSNVCR